jgi:uncharacterized membrane protein
MRRSKKKSVRLIAAAAGLGVVAGLRSMATPAILSWAANRGWMRAHGGPVRVLRTRGAAGVTSAMAVGEMIMDMSPLAPDRRIAASLAARIASGALVGSALCAAKHKPVAWGMLAGGLGALAGTYGGFRLRKRLAKHFPDPLVAVAEDAVALGGGALLVKAA